MVKFVAMESQADTAHIINQNEDLTQILPIQQKRTIAFVNGFIMQTVSFLNNFAQSCESQFMELEYRMQKLEASLLILESQLSSIETLKSVVPETENSVSENIKVNDTTVPSIIENQENEIVLPEIESKSEEMKVKLDLVYKKFFKMVKVRVPVEAVKLKMQSEGLDPNVLDITGDIEFEGDDRSGET